MAVQRLYRCDLCKSGSDNLKGLLWKFDGPQAAERLRVVDNWREVEHHICPGCLADLRGERA